MRSLRSATRPARRNFQSQFRARHRQPSRPSFFFWSIRRGQNFLGFLFRGTRAIRINFFRAFRRFRQHDHALRQNFRVSAEHNCVMCRRAFAIAQLTVAHRGQQRRVPRQNSQVAVQTGKLNFHGRRADYPPFRRDDFKFERLRQHIFSV
jgi:hypothetical protein